MKRMFLGLLWATAALGLALLLASAAGRWHPAGDSLAVVRWQIAVGLALIAAVMGALGARRAIWLLVPASLALGQAGWAWFAPQVAPVSAISLYQKNLSFRLGEPAPLIADIRAAAPEVLTLQEVTERNKAVLRGVEDILPTQHWCPGITVGGPALATRWPAVPGTAFCGSQRSLAAIQVMAPEGPLWLVSAHLSWPWPYSQDAYVERILMQLAALEGPVLLGGDFNMVPWGARNRRIAAVTGTTRIGRPRNSFPRFGPLFPLPIDLVYAPAGATGRADLRPLFGSDHRGILARIDM